MPPKPETTRSARITRREFVERGVGAVVAAGLAGAAAAWLHDGGSSAAPDGPSVAPPLPNYFAAVDWPPSHPRLSVATGNEARIEPLVRAAIAGLDPQRGLRRFVGPGDTVLIKPNAGFDRPPHLGATTHPEVLRALVRLCHEAGAPRVLVTDFPVESAEVCFARCGLAAVVREEGAELVLPTPTHFRSVALHGTAAAATSPHSGGPTWPVLYETLAEATKLIGVAPTKDHNLAGGSMLLKNWYGLLGGRRQQFHQAIDEIISDLATWLSPTLVVADGTRVMLRNGPTGGRASDVRPGGIVGQPVIVAAVDPVACDAWCYQHLLGRDPATLPYLGLASAKIAADVAAGARRCGQSDWADYARRGLLASVQL